jgi:hypothetical protein
VNEQGVCGGPDERRGITELNGEGEVASGVALQRFGQNALDVIDNVKARLADMAAALPKGVEIIPVYDRSNLIHSAIETLKRTLTEESIFVAIACTTQAENQLRADSNLLDEIQKCSDFSRRQMARGVVGVERIKFFRPLRQDRHEVSPCQERCQADG